VQPNAILLERLNVDSSPNGLLGLLQRVEKLWGWNGDQDLLGDPYWFQDNADGKCLGPGGFSECGDATLWRIRRRPLSKAAVTRKKQREEQWRRERQRQLRREQQQRARNKKKGDDRQPYKRQRISSFSVCVWPFFCEKDSRFQQPASVAGSFDDGDDFDSAEGFALQLMDIDAITANSSFSASRVVELDHGMYFDSILGKAATGYARMRLKWGLNRERDESIDLNSECLLPYSRSKNGKEALKIGPCSAQEAWVWQVDQDGVLVKGPTKSERHRTRRKSVRSHDESGSTSNVACVHRTNTSVATLSSCQDSLPTEGVIRVGFSLVRYPSAQTKIAPQLSEHPGAHDELPWTPWTTLQSPLSRSENVSHNNSSLSSSLEGKAEQHMPTSRRNSQNHATGARQRHLEVKSTESMLRTTLGKGGQSKSQNAAKTSASHIRDSPTPRQGMTFHEQSVSGAAKSRGSMSKGIDIARPDERTGQFKSSLLHKPRHQQGLGQGQNNLKSFEGGINDVDSNPHRPRKIPVHPYIASSKDGVWIDPLTSLEYPTDLCTYLGHTKKEAGRHTLMGVGQYYRTAFNIKVYGAALYVAKRDVLADPKFAKYAMLSADELRFRDDFYEHLMNMPPPDSDPSSSPGGFFDRSLFIKLNMQLSTDAMRKSLEADWSLMTEEMKTLLIGTSFRERMADERMLRKIESKENSSNCSCGQSAPPEYAADPTCCARGTELVFTWRKNGDFEVRLDGRVMDTFPRPDMAKGIFTEYMNHDPISLDAKAHFTDGFPFLLAPLAQVKGMSSAVPPPQDSTKKTKSPGNNPMLRLMDVAMTSMGAVNSQAHSLSKWMQDGAAEITSNIENALDGAVGVARGISAELERHRMEMIENALLLQEEGLKMISSYMKSSIEGKEMMALTIVDNNNKKGSGPFTFSRGSMFDTYSDDATFMSPVPEILPDEIGITIGPTMNFTHCLFFTTVHVYLMLLLVVSFPGSDTKRMVIKRRISETKKFGTKSLAFGSFSVKKDAKE